MMAKTKKMPRRDSVESLITLGSIRFGTDRGNFCVDKLLDAWIRIALQLVR